MKPVRIIFAGLMCGVVTASRADIASTQYVQSLIAQPNWDEDNTTAPGYIQNKPTIPSSASDVGADASGTAAGLVGTLSNLNTTDKTNVVAAVNEVNTSVSAKQDKQIGAAKVDNADSTDINKAVIVGADGKMTVSNSALGSAAYTASTDYDASGTAAGLVGTLSNLNTTDKTNVVAAINEVNTAVSAKQNEQIGAAKVNDADSTDINKAVIVGADGKMTISTNALGSAAYTASTDYVPTARTVNSKALSSDISLVGSDIALTGYSLPNSTSAIAATDTINAAIGKLEKGLLPVGTTSGTVAAGDDARFDSVSITQPSGTPPTGRVWFWFN